MNDSASSEHVSPRMLASVVYAEDAPSLDDPAELYHEASKAYPSFLARELPGLARLEADPTLQRIVTRAVKRHPHLPSVTLPEPERLDEGFSSVLRRRRSLRELSMMALPLGHLATILHAAYGLTHDGSQPRRTVPSGGALYPLELYVIAHAVNGLTPGLYHYDPLRHVLEDLRQAELRTAVTETMVYPELAAGPALVVATAMFWRTRFKYGLRGYRFALLEAGHVMQNLLLACTALGLAAVPVGGFYDRRLEAILRIDGVNESALYCAAIGNGAESD